MSFALTTFIIFGGLGLAAAGVAMACLGRTLVRDVSLWDDGWPGRGLTVGIGLLAYVAMPALVVTVVAVVAMEIGAW